MITRHTPLNQRDILLLNYVKYVCKKEEVRLTYKKYTQVINDIS